MRPARPFHKKPQQRIRHLNCTLAFEQLRRFAYPFRRSWRVLRSLIPGMGLDEVLQRLGTLRGPSKLENKGFVKWRANYAMARGHKLNASRLGAIYNSMAMMEYCRFVSQVLLKQRPVKNVLEIGPNVALPLSLAPQSKAAATGRGSLPIPVHIRLEVWAANFKMGNRTWHARCSPLSLGDCRQ